MRAMAASPTPGSGPRLTAVIDEASCIGCTLCIDACPVDAIIGAAKRMHTVLPSWCTGCELCVPPCPVDCITIVPAAQLWDAAALAAAAIRTEQRITRLARRERISQRTAHSDVVVTTREQRHELAAAALVRARARRSRA